MVAISGFSDWGPFGQRDSPRPRSKGLAPPPTMPRGYSPVPSRSMGSPLPWPDGPRRLCRRNLAGLALAAHNQERSLQTVHGPIRDAAMAPAVPPTATMGAED